LWRYFANRFLTLSENLLVGAKLSEYHSGYRAFSRQLLEHLNLEKNSEDFVFDNQMLIQIIWHGYAIGEVTCPTDYTEEASFINFTKIGVGRQTKTAHCSHLCLVTGISMLSLSVMCES
jgi:hypothetical protein